MNSNHRGDIKEVNRVNRHLKIKPTAQTELQLAIEEISSLYGIENVTFDEKSKSLNLTYDASILSIETINNILDKNQIKMSLNWWNRLKLTHYKFVDHNVKDNETYQAQCCNKRPPKI